MRTSGLAVLVVLVGAAMAGTVPALAQGAGGMRDERRMIVTQVETVHDLAAVCDPAWGGVPRLEAIAYCQGFITSAGQYHALLHPRNGRRRPLYCLPTPRPTVADTGLGFAAWARANPSHAR